MKKTLHIQSTAAALVYGYLDQRFGYQMHVYNITNTPTNAADNFKIFLPNPAFWTTVAVLYEDDDTTIKVAVDVAAGHIVKGHTVTQDTDFLLAMTSAGVELRVITTVADDAGEDYCTLTIAELDMDLPVGTKVWIVRPADILAYVSGGTAVVTLADFCDGHPNMPICVSAISAGDNNQDVSVSVEYQRVRR